MAEEHKQESSLNIDIEFCGFCNYAKHCAELAEKLKAISPDVNVVCQKGRQGSFEIKVNDNLIYSKMQTMALPDYDEVVSNVKTALEDGPIQPVKKQQPITCVVS